MAVNEAVERAHREGILNTASLMVAADAAADAVRRARALPGLGVGLHLVLADGKPALPATEIPALVGADGLFSSRLVSAGARFFFRKAARRQLGAEIRAQFERFRQTGLVLDHVNAHHHMHLHPTVLALIIEIGGDYGVRAVRLPYEPFFASWRAAREGLGRRLVNDLCLRPLTLAHRRRLARAGIGCNDYVFGMNDTTAMNRDRLIGFLDHLPDGVSEIFCHPTAAPMRNGASEPRLAGADDELGALTDHAVASTMRTRGIEMTSFAALAPPE